MKFVDSHCHLDRINLEKFNSKFSNLIDTIKAQNISHMLCVAVHPDSWETMKLITEPFSFISLSYGIHPGDIKHDDIHRSIESFTPYLTQDNVIAVGETGLDYHYGADNKVNQQSLFVLQIEAAKTYKKPLIIHTREARKDTMSILTSYEARECGGVMHCFTEDWDMAKKALDIGFYISFSGIITFNSASEIQEVAKKVPFDRILIETDSPYLAPVPHRGKENTPAYVPLVAQKIAEIKSCTVEDIANITTQNFQTLFKITI